MLDLACILFSTVMCVFVAFRAVVLDRERPWFTGAVAAPDASPVQAQGRIWRDRGRQRPGTARRTAR